jgi:hypothetical protein
VITPCCGDPVPGSLGSVVTKNKTLRSLASLHPHGKHFSQASIPFKSSSPKQSGELLAGYYRHHMKKIKPYIFIIAVLTSNSTQAQDPGFFLDDWQPKNIISPAYNETPKPTGAINATVIIDAASIINKISKSVFGINSNPYMGQMVTEPVLLDHIKNLSPNIIRAPGGSLSDIYFFNAADGQPPADAPDTLFDSNGNKAKAFYWYGKNTASWTLSINNYYSMLQQTGSKGIITINYGYARYGTGLNPVQTAAHLAAEWVRYDNGRTRYWEIGNESAGPWEAGYKIDVTKNKDGQPQIISGSLYGQHFKIFADSMRKAAAETGATIKIGAQLIQYDATASGNTVDANWNAGYFASARNYADFYIVHSYFTAYNQNSSASIILNSAATETKNIMDYMKATTTLAAVDLKPIALTEWNIFAVGSKQQVSHINGMHAVLLLGEVIKNKYGQASRWDLANGWANGDDHGMFNIGDEPDAVAKWNPRPPFYHMYYFQKFMGDRMVNATVTGSADIACYASTFSSGQVAAVIVNKGTGTQLTQLYFQNFVPGDRYYWYTLTGSNDNGEFSRKVLINGNGPAGAAGGPADYASIKANAATAGFDVKISAPPRSVTFVVVEKNATITAVTDIDPANKRVRIYPNPSVRGEFTIQFNGFAATDVFDVTIINAAGQAVWRRNVKNSNRLQVIQYLQSGIYIVKIKTAKGITTKKLIVH